METKRVDLKQVAAAALNMSHTLVPEWLPDGKREGAEWVALRDATIHLEVFVDGATTYLIEKSRG